MKYTALLFVGMSIFSSSCRKIGICHDAEFSIKKTTYTGSQLRTDGFYYGGGSSNGAGSRNFRIAIFYTNGIVYLPGMSDSSKMEDYVSNKNGKSIKKIKYDWGLFSIDGATIKIEHWPPKFMGCNDAEMKSGTILNDTTFVLTKLELKKPRNKTKTSEINETYHFRHYKYKPDSTNDFVN